MTSSDQHTTLISLNTGIGDMRFGRDERLTREEAERKLAALAAFRSAYEAQMLGDLDGAAELYRQSIERYATAEAHTFLGWTYSFMGLTDDAIEECRRAIAVDPEFGNPYNDIGAYLFESGDVAGSIPWLKRALVATRYECYFFPHYNLGRAYEALGRVFDALREYAAAVRLKPDYSLAIKALRILQSKLN